jgi:hypothetical protein
MVYYIIAVSKEGNEDEAQVTEYLVNTDGNTNYGTRYSKEDFWRKVENTYRSDIFYCLNAKNLPSTRTVCYWRFDAGIPYLQTEANQTTKDNLLQLPGIAN